MPYIPRETRVQLSEVVDAITKAKINTPGQLNYLISKLIEAYITKNELRYQTINDVEGALNCASKEFYRRVVAPFEDSKIEENGDVYDI